MATATIPFTGTFDADPVHSSFNFAVRYQGVSLFRGAMEDVQAELVAEESGARLQGAAKVESISVRTPEQFRAHLLSDEFFGAERHPEVQFTSSSIDFADDGTVKLEGELTIKGITRPVVAAGTYQAPATDAFGGTRGHLNLEAVVDRTQFDMNWNMPLPAGGNALANDVTLIIDASLVARAEA